MLGVLWACIERNRTQAPWFERDSNCTPQQPSRTLFMLSFFPSFQLLQWTWKGTLLTFGGTPGTRAQNFLGFSCDHAVR